MPGLQSVSQPVISKQQIGSQLGCVYQFKKNWFSLPQSEGKRCLTTWTKISALPKLPANGLFWLLDCPDYWFWLCSFNSALFLAAHYHCPSPSSIPPTRRVHYHLLSTSHTFWNNYILTSQLRGTGLSENESKLLWIGNRQAGSLGPDNWV